MRSAPPSGAPSSPSAAGSRTDPATIFVVDDHRASAEALGELLEDDGHRVRTFTSPEPVLGALREAAEASAPVDLLITDLRMDGMDGVELLRGSLGLDPSLPVIIVTAHATIPRAVEATRAGAFSFLTKPIDIESLRVQVRNALAMRKLSRAVQARTDDPDPIIGHSAALQRALAAADRAAATDMTVLITGESGTGKELFARRLHRRSRRRSGPFVPVNCGALPEGLIEAELFGAARGSYTGAHRDREGLVESADGGTLFLDEVGELSPAAQVRLLRVLQEGTIRRLGENRDRRVDVRVVAATHRDLRDGGFRADLYYRLNVIPIALPPLRARGDDVLLLFGRALRRACAEVRRPVPRVSDEAMDALLSWSWPGNVRELLHLADRIAVLCPGEVVELADLPEEMVAARRDADTVVLPSGDFDLTGWLEGLEERALRRALARHDGVKARAAASLGLERTALRYKLKKYGIEG
ncbi:MAG: sigma-54-dependent Fis family transcriptional regulator [Deltaproteobacteria bacterium]|nr:MAG: sigma-54-dependent Fis family transcriptional regulator [Deltaproteobacteria bacterium]